MPSCSFLSDKHRTFFLHVRCFWCQCEIASRQQWKTKRRCCHTPSAHKLCYSWGRCWWLVHSPARLLRSSPAYCKLQLCTKSTQKLTASRERQQSEHSKTTATEHKQHRKKSFLTILSYDKMWRICFLKGPNLKVLCNKVCKNI